MNFGSIGRGRTAGWILLWLIGAVARLAAGTDYDARRYYDKSEHNIAMRDGVKLYTQVYSPRDRNIDYPILLFRTPYSVGFYGPRMSRLTLGPNPLYAREGFIFVYQDVRGKFRSEGDFVVMKPMLPDSHGPRETDETTDTYDTIEWLLRTLPHHNGRVGQWGISYPGWQTVMGMINAHPAFRAASPQASPADMWIGDDFHHNGAFRLMYTFGWLSSHAAARDGAGERRSARFDFGTPDGYRFFLELGPVRNVDRKYFHGRVPTWNDYMEHGDYDAWWKKQDVLPRLRNIRPAVLNVAGWFDAEDFYGPMKIYAAIENNDPGNRSTLVVGPWRHGGWARGDGDRLGDIVFDSATSRHFQEQVEFPFFLHYLKDKGPYDPPEALVFETGSNRWRSYDAWPPRETRESRLYLREDGGLVFDAPPAARDAFDAYVSDPGRPVPYTAEIRTSQGHEWMVEDQRFAASRPDVLVYESGVLDEDVTIAGPVIADLHVSVTGTDADFVVKLIDVFPGDAPDPDPNPRRVRMGHFQMLVGADVFRGKYRRGYENPEPFVPGEITRIRYDLRDKYHCFRKGHRIMVQIQSTWFPLIDRNPQTFTDIYHADESAFIRAEHRIHRSSAHPTHLVLRILRP